MARPSQARSFSGVVLGLLAFVGVVAVRAPARADSCKADGQACRTNQSCCSGACVNGAPPGTKPFGVCCTPTTCAAQGATCGTIPDGCGGTLNCGTCTTTTSTATTATSAPTTTTTLPSCVFNDSLCETICLTDADCPEGRTCAFESGFRCEPKLTDGRACRRVGDCFSGCCCGAALQGLGFCAEPGDQCAAGTAIGCQCPGVQPCGQDSDCCSNQFCTGGFCFQKQLDGSQCVFNSGCTSGCCCVVSGDSTGTCQHDDTTCGGTGGACLP